MKDKFPITVISRFDLIGGDDRLFKNNGEDIPSRIQQEERVIQEKNDGE